MSQKRMPAYGKRIMEMRRSGKVPTNRVMVTFDWSLAKAYPRIVIADDMSADHLNFTYLAGLAVQVVYRQKDAHRISAIVAAILEINPSSLVTFALDLVESGNAATLIKPYQNIQLAEAA
jgi:hypothetical protein